MGPKGLKREISCIHDILPLSLLIFSKVTPCALWSTKEFTYLDKIRKRVNRSLEKCLPLVQGLSFRHTDLEDIVPGFFLPDGVTFSPIGFDMFNLGLQCMVELGLWHLGGGGGSSHIDWSRWG